MKSDGMTSRIGRIILKRYDLLSFDPYYAKFEEISCRDARDSDVDAILAIESASFEFPWSRQDFDFCLTLDRCGALVAERGGRIVGYLVYETRRHSIRLLSCAVEESERRSGVGSALLYELMGRPGATRTEIACFVRERNVAAQLFLRKIGFCAQWVSRRFYSAAEEDAYRMSWKIDAEHHALKAG